MSIVSSSVTITDAECFNSATGQTVSLSEIECYDSSTGITTTVWTRELIIFNGGVTRSGDAFNGHIYWNNGDSGWGSYSATGGTSLYSTVSMANYDRVAYSGGMLKLPVDISNFSTLHVQFTSAITNASTSQVEFGLSQTLQSGNVSRTSIPMKSNAISTAYGSTTELALDLSAFKSAYGNSGYFTWFANKHADGNSGGATISITKVWFT